MRLPSAIAILLAAFLLMPALSFAQNTSSLAQSQVVAGKPKNGNIITSQNGKFQLSTKVNDNDIFGVVSLSSAISLETANIPGSYPLVSSGTTEVLVTNTGGNIKKGDPITSSTIPGVGERESSNGFILGIALEDY